MGNKRIVFGKTLLKALSRCGVVRVSRDLVNQIFMGKRGRKYPVIREEFFLDHTTNSGDRFAYRVAKDYGNVFYKDYLKMTLGREFAGIMDHADIATEKCGDVEIWLGPGPTKKHISFMDTRADPGELLAGLEASINVFQGTTPSTQTLKLKAALIEVDAHNVLRERQGAQDPMWLIEDREIEIICGLYAQPLKKDEDDPMGEAGQSEGAGQPASFGAASSSTEENAERSSRCHARS